MLALLGFNGIDWALIAVAGYLAVMPLIRLMRARRDAILDELGRQIAEEQERRDAKRRQAEQRRIREEFCDWIAAALAPFTGGRQRLRFALRALGLQVVTV